MILDTNNLSFISESQVLKDTLLTAGTGAGLGLAAAHFGNDYMQDNLQQGVDKLLRNADNFNSPTTVWNPEAMDMQSDLNSMKDNAMNHQILGATAGAAGGAGLGYLAAKDNTK